MSTQGPQTPHGSGVGPFPQFNARARIRAEVVLPHPRGPVKRNACATRPVFKAFTSVRTTCSCPVRSENRWGRYLRARTRYGVFIGGWPRSGVEEVATAPSGARPRTGHTAEDATVAPFRAWRVHDPPSPDPRSSARGGGADRVPRITSDSRRRNLAARPPARNALPGLPPRWPEGGSQDHPEPRLEPALQLRQPRGVAGPLLHRREALPHLGRRVVELDGALQGRVRVGPAPLGARDEAERVLGIERVRRLLRDGSAGRLGRRGRRSGTA